MSTTTLRGIVRGKTIVLAENETLPPEGTEVFVTPVPRQDNAGLLAAVRAGPMLTAEEAAELERVIELGRRPLSVISPFELNDGPGTG